MWEECVFFANKLKMWIECLMSQGTYSSIFSLLYYCCCCYCCCPMSTVQVWIFFFLHHNIQTRRIHIRVNFNRASRERKSFIRSYFFTHFICNQLAAKKNLTRCCWFLFTKNAIYVVPQTIPCKSEFIVLHIVPFTPFSHCADVINEKCKHLF